MDRIELSLNPRKIGNFAFFCPVSKLHLTVSNPTGSVDRITSPILRGLKSRALIDVNGVVNLETGNLNEAVATVTTKEEVKSETVTTQDKVESTDSQEAEVVADNKSSNKKGKRAEAKPVDEAAAQSEE